MILKQPKNLEEIVTTYQQMADLTQPRCASCPVPLSCCAPEYCAMATDFARMCGVELTRTEHVRLPYMGPNGCTVPPHLRPLCTIHVCEGHLMFDVDGGFSTEYFRLREKINRIDHQRLNRLADEFMNRKGNDGTPL